MIITSENLTADLIKQARDQWPDKISSECSANALGLPESHTDGGLPVYPSPRVMYRARLTIATLINARSALTVAR